MTYVPSFAVDGFFAVSGYLITQSRLRLTFGSFVWRRALRIFPGLWVCLIVTAFVIAPLSTLSTGKSFDIGDGVAYVIRNLALNHGGWAIGDTLASAPMPDQWNGSLWTLGYEFGCYVIVGMVLALAWFRARAMALVLAGLTAMAVLRFGFGIETLGVAPVRLGSFFAAGALLRLAGDRVPFSGRIAALCMLAVPLVYFAGASWYLAIAPLALAYLLLWLACDLPIRFGSVNDVSYGMYVYAFPVQQLLVAVGVSQVGVPLLAICAVGLSATLAWLSWRLVEKPALGLRRTAPMSSLQGVRQSLRGRARVLGPD